MYNRYLTIDTAIFMSRFALASRFLHRDVETKKKKKKYYENKLLFVINDLKIIKSRLFRVLLHHEPKS